MNKKVTLIAGVVILLLIIGIAAFFMSNKKDEPQMQNKTQETENQTASNTSGNSPTSLRDLLLAGASQKCTYKQTTDSNEMEGTSYISGGKVRSDFTTTTEETTTTGHNIFDGKTSYVWMDGSNSGFMTDTTPTTETDNNPSKESQGVDMNKDMNYQCQGWVPDQSLFTPPANIEFRNFSAPVVTGDTTTNTQDLCDTCNQLTGDQKTQCLSALRCN